MLGTDPGLCGTNLGRDSEALRERGVVEPEVGGERAAVVGAGARGVWASQRQGKGRMGGS